MVNHTCPKCKKVFNRRSHYNYHVYKRKKPCTTRLECENIKSIIDPMISKDSLEAKKQLGQIIDIIDSHIKLLLKTKLKDLEQDYPKDISNYFEVFADTTIRPAKRFRAGFVYFTAKKLYGVDSSEDSDGTNTKVNDGSNDGDNSSDDSSSSDGGCFLSIR